MKNAAHPGLILAFGLAILGCGGSGGGGSDAAAPADDSLKDVVALEGQWLSGLCVVKADGQTSSKSVYIVTKLTDSGINFRSGSVTYGTANCSGSGALSEFTVDLGSVEFSSTLLLGESQYFRGIYSVSNGTKTPVIWALPTTQKLCVMTDSEPTVFPNAQKIKEYVDVLAAETCYYKS